MVQMHANASENAKHHILEENMRSILKTALGALALFSVLTAPALAGSYPEKAATVIVPFPPGGASDTIGRLVADAMQQQGFGQPIVAENKAGANGAAGALMVARAPADGYTFLVGSIGVFSINSALRPDLEYDPRKDFDMLSIAVRTPNALVTKPDMAAGDVKALIADLKANPKKMLFASSGVGSSDHLTAELFWQKTGTAGVHVPYKGGGPAQKDLMGGHADASFQNLGSITGFVKEGKMKLLAITSGERMKELPDVPTLKEAGVEGVEVYSWQAFAAPKGLPADVKAKLESSIIAALKSPTVSAKLQEMGFEVIANDGTAATAFVNDEIARWTDVVKAGGITAAK
jgi:tripartite-type tricarboxylate transporter receptor subunit TctC